jgi:hypothetical protein
MKNPAAKRPTAGTRRTTKKGRPVIAFYPNAQNPTARQSHPTARLKTLIKKHLFLIKKTWIAIYASKTGANFARLFYE